jgi:cytochrome c553
MSKHPIRRAALAAALVAVAAAGGAHAQGDPARGKTKSASCAACHGADGNGENAAFPRIAGQHASYIVYALEAYTTGERTNAIMQGMAAPLSKQDREDLAAYFASQNGLKTLKGQR